MFIAQRLCTSVGISLISIREAGDSKQKRPGTVSLHAVGHG